MFNGVYERETETDRRKRRKEQGREGWKNCEQKAKERVLFQTSENLAASESWLIH